MIFHVESLQEIMCLMTRRPFKLKKVNSCKFVAFAGAKGSCKHVQGPDAPPAQLPRWREKGSLPHSKVQKLQP